MSDAVTTGSVPTVTPRVDARAKADGSMPYAGDVALPGACHLALVRSELPHAAIRAIHVDEARRVEGVLDVFTAERVDPTVYGRSVHDIPILARGEVRYVGERVAAVVAETRAAAEAAAALVVVDYDPLPAVTDVEAALAPGAPVVQERAWELSGAVIGAHDPRNLQSIDRHGDEAAADAALASAPHVLDRTYTTPSGHAGYIEPHATLVTRDDDGRVHVWVTDKSPYKLRAELSRCLGLDPSTVVVHEVAIGGDFGGKGSYGEAILCTELNRLLGRPIRHLRRYGDDLVSPAPRHSLSLRVRLAADDDGTLLGFRFDVLADGGAYAGYKVRPRLDLHGLGEVASAYRIPATFVDARIVYTHTVPRGHVRAPGSPQAAFAFESALDELAAAIGCSPVDIRRRNLLRTGEPDPHGHEWAEVRALETLEAAVGAPREPVEVPSGCLTGVGLAVSSHDTPSKVGTALRLTEESDGTILVETPIPETGTGSHTVVRESIARALGVPSTAIRVRQAATDGLAQDLGVGGSRITASIARAAVVAGEAWAERGEESSVTVVVSDDDALHLNSYCVQIARVAVDPGSGRIHVLELLSAVDVADVVHEASHQMQIDGGALMGLGFACLEDLQVQDGRVWAASLGEFKIPSLADAPRLRTVLVPGAMGAGDANVKAIGELTNVPTAAAIANAVADATGIRLTDLPLRAETLWRELRRVGARPAQRSAPSTDPMEVRA